jgi:hypothetical protein
MARAISRREFGELRLALLDEPRVFGEAAAVEEEGHAVFLADRLRAADIGERDGLAAAGVVRDGDHRERHLAGVFREAALERGKVHVALERRAEGGFPPLGHGQVEGDGAARLDVGAGGVEVRVVRHDVAGLQHGGEQDALRGAALVRGDDVGEAGDVAHGRLEAIE